MPSLKLVAAAMFLAPLPVLAAPHFTDIYNFHDNQGIDDGITPQDVIIDKGILYGVAYEGGTSNKGIVFAVALTGTETILHSFAGGADGGFPVGGLTVAGTLAYGTATTGGSSNKGVIYSIDLTTGAETILHSFSGGDGDGDTPYSNLLLYKSKLYGTTLNGGQYGSGTVFVFDPATGIESILSNVAQVGQNPEAGLAVYNGALYGTAAYGLSGYGSVFKIDLTTKITTVVHDFNNTDGSLPDCTLTVHASMIYGCTAEGGNLKNQYGTVFSLNPATNAFVSLHSFTSADGYGPIGRMAVTDAGIFVTPNGGGPANDGVLARVNATTGVTKVAHGFVGTDGAYPEGIVYANGLFYGSTQAGGSQGHGVVYRYKQ
jgi:uncharacterized repeat protein (TIGR03803 family)